MLILAAMFVALFHSYCWVCLKEGFFLFLQHQKIAKERKASFFQVEQLPKIFLICLCRATALYNLGMVTVLFTNTKKSLKFYGFKSAQILVFFHCFEFVFFVWLWFLLLPKLALFLICS